MTVDVIRGDCRDVLPNLPADSFDAIVTDTPYHLTTGKKGGSGPASVNLESPYGRARIGTGFMGMKWDGGDVAFQVETWQAALRVLKPGGHLLAFGGTRTYHRLACAIEDAGFEIRDQIQWIYASGFPKSLNVSKAIDQQQRGGMVRAKLLHFAEARGISGKWLEERGVASASSFADWTTGGHVPSDANWQIVKAALEVTAEEESTFERAVIARGTAGLGQGRFHATAQGGGYGFAAEYDVTAPATDLASQWDGWGTALKPAHEPIVLARKPLIGTVAANVAAHGCGPLNIDGCRITVNDDAYARNCSGDRGHAGTRSEDETGSTNMRPGGGSAAEGRWPANVCHDGSAEVVERFPAEAGAFAPVRGLEPSAVTGDVYGDRARVPGAFHGDSGSAARFFYCAKASREDRDEGCDAFDKKPLLWSAGTQNPGSFQSPNTEREARNFHPTVKPTALMRWLVRLVTPPGGKVLDFFAGSGSTGKACELEGFDCVLIEGEADYIPIIDARLAFAREERRIATFRERPVPRLALSTADIAGRLD